MAHFLGLRIRPAFSRMQWRRGLRAGLAVGAAMLFCRLLHRPMGWAALGALQVSTVDNGGPYRSRLANMLAVLLPGSLAVLIGTFAGLSLPAALLITFALCFLTTLSRVISQPLAASSVFILICYIVAFGSPVHSFAAGFTSLTYFLLGGLWASALALLFWPVDPFAPARLAVADLIAALIQLSAALPSTTTADSHRHFNELVARTRLRIEQAHAALAATPARMTARTVRARNLTVLTESADLLLARILRLSALAPALASPEPLQAIDIWLAASLAPLELALRERPFDNASAFAPDGSLALNLHRAEALVEAAFTATPALPPDITAYLISTLRDALFNLEVAFESIRAIWTGSESRDRQIAQFRAPAERSLLGGVEFRASLSGQTTRIAAPLVWLEALRSNLTLRSLMFRHALRLAAVVTLDVLLMHFIHVTHGYWLAMTSIIVLRPFAGETVTRSAERVVGTVAGGILAALLTAVLPSQTEMLAVVTFGTIAAISIYAVDYAWYSFFLTPTIVLLTLPNLHDWHLAAIRTGMTGLGALIAVLAMLLLWPERESLQLPTLLARAAAADAAYLRATLAFWQQSAQHPAQHSGSPLQTPPHADESGANSTSTENRIRLERTLLAPARRLCGLATNDAEDTLDHALLEHAIPLNPTRDRTAQLNRAALTFTTYLRRLNQTITLLAALGDRTPAQASHLSTLALRLDAITTTLTHPSPPPTPPPDPPPTPTPETTLPPTLTSQQILRLDRQISILERTTSDIAQAITPNP